MISKNELFIPFTHVTTTYYLNGVITTDYITSKQNSRIVNGDYGKIYKVVKTNTLTIDEEDGVELHPKVSSDVLITNDERVAHESYEKDTYSPVYNSSTEYWLFYYEPGCFTTKEITLKNRTTACKLDLNRPPVNYEASNPNRNLRSTLKMMQNYFSSEWISSNLIFFETLVYVIDSDNNCAFMHGIPYTRAIEYIRDKVLFMQYTPNLVNSDHQIYTSYMRVNLDIEELTLRPPVYILQPDLTFIEIRSCVR